MNRYIGIRHRIKKTADGEARPTQVAILENGKFTTHNLADEEAEMDFLLHRLPVKYRPVRPDEDLRNFHTAHVNWRKLKKDENPDDHPENLRQKVGKTWNVAVEVPVEYAGLESGDTVALVLGGSGDSLAAGFSRYSELEGMEGTRVMRISPAVLKERRKREKEEDGFNLAELASTNSELFYPVTVRERTMINVRQTYFDRTAAMKTRIALEQRLRQSSIGKVFRNEDALYPEGRIEAALKAIKTSDEILQMAEEEEAKYLGEMTAALEQFAIYRELFSKIQGIGPAIAVRIIASVGDIRRFPNKAKFKAYCGVHVLANGEFPRQRRGVKCNWDRSARQGFFLAGDMQFVYNADSVWGQKLREYKIKLREKHPEVVMVTGKDGKPKKRYTNGHIHKMAVWRTITKFAEWLFKEWRRLEKEMDAQARQAA